ncbi:MAG: zf-HC2 domain-containing protein, partial [Acidimicrobiales bacterium]
MGGSLNHHQLEELLGAYALDAVDGPEAEAVELHLRECPRCRDEVAAHREAAALLAHIGAPAPAGVWERIAGGLQEAPPPRIELARLATVTPLRAEPSRRYPIVLVAAAAMAAAVSVVLGVRLNEQSGRMTELRGVVSDLRGVIDGQALSSEVLRGLLAEDAQVVHLVSSGGAPQADALLLPDGRGYLVNVALAALPDSQT